jgi:hypothetical protein
MLVAVRVVASIAVVYAMALFAMVLTEERQRRGQRRWGLAWWLNTVTIACLVSPVALLWL